MESISPSIRLIMAMFSLHAGAETDPSKCGQEIYDNIVSAFDGLSPKVEPEQIQHTVESIIKTQNQDRESIIDFLTYANETNWYFLNQHVGKLKDQNKNVERAIEECYNVIRFQCDKKTNWGRAVIDMLRKSFPDQHINVRPEHVGGKLFAIARRQSKNSFEGAEDAVQDFLGYVTGYDGGKGWDWTRNSSTWESALSKVYSNVNRKSMDKSKEYDRRSKKEKSTDDAFGSRDEGSAPEGGEQKMPTDTQEGISDVESYGALGKPLDDSAAIKQFYSVLDDNIPALKSYLDKDQLSLFNLVFEENVGGFGSDIKQNMGQATALKEIRPDLFERFGKRWSGYVNDLRKSLLRSIWEFIDTKMSDEDYEKLREYFFSENSPRDISKTKFRVEQDKKDYQRGIDERKLARFKWMDENEHDTMTAKEFTSYTNLVKKLRSQGVDTDAIKPVKPTGKDLDDIEGGVPSLSSYFKIASIVAGSFSDTSSKYAKWVNSLKEVEASNLPSELSDNMSDVLFLFKCGDIDINEVVSDFEKHIGESPDVQDGYGIISAIANDPSFEEVMSSHKKIHDILKEIEHMDIPEELSLIISDLVWLHEFGELDNSGITETFDMFKDRADEDHNIEQAAFKLSEISKLMN